MKIDQQNWLVNLFLRYSLVIFLSMRVFLPFCLFFIISIVPANVLHSQEWNTARLQLLYGGNQSFHFNSLQRIKKGIEIQTGTRFGITMADSVRVGPVLQGFTLNFRAFNHQAELKGDVYTLPLNKIKVKAENVIGLEAGTSHGFQDLTTEWTPLFTYTNTNWVNLNWAMHQLNISYQIGKSVSEGGNGVLMGENPDYYSVEIEFELVPTGPGF